MSDWNPFDFAVTHVKKQADGTIGGIKGRVIEDGTVRDLPIELTVAKAMEYLGYDGVFCTALEDGDELKPGSEIIVDDSSSPPQLTTVADAPEAHRLDHLPGARTDDDGEG